MTNKDLLEFIKEFLEGQEDRLKEEWYTTRQGVSEDVMDYFIHFLQDKRIRIKEL